MAIGVQRLRLPTVGELRDKVEIQRNTLDSPDGRGGYEDDWESFATVWARILQVSAHAEFLAMQADYNVSHQVIVRSLDELQLARGDRVVWPSREGERFLIIESIRELENKGRWTELLCIERPGDDS